MKRSLGYDSLILWIRLRAIAAYTTALLVYTRSVFPGNWVATPNRLGNASRYRIKGDVNFFDANDIDYFLTKNSSSIVTPQWIVDTDFQIN